MKVAMLDTRAYDREAFDGPNTRVSHELSFFEPRLTKDTAGLAAEHEAVCSFVNDRPDEPALRRLRDVGVRLVALRSAGYNHVDLRVAAMQPPPAWQQPEQKA